MLYNSRALMIAWGVSVAVLAGVFLTLQFTYEPPVAEPDDLLAQEEGAITSEGEAPEASGELSVVTPLYLDELIEQSQFGDLPRIGSDGRQPWQTYSSPGIAVADPRARIAIIVKDMGLRTRNTQRAFDNLPDSVSFAFSPYGSDLDIWAQAARQKGHEILMSVPMESINFAQENPGDLALLAEKTAGENIKQLKEILGKMHGYNGVMPHMGSRFTATVEDIQGPVLDELKLRGLLYIDNSSNPNSRSVAFSRARQIPTAFVNRHIDKELVRDQINAELLELEARARQFGAAVGEAQAIPISINAIKQWITTLNPEEVVLVPVSDIIEQQPTPQR